MGCCCWVVVVVIAVVDGVDVVICDAVVAVELSFFVVVALNVDVVVVAAVVVHDVDVLKLLVLLSMVFAVDVVLWCAGDLHSDLILRGKRGRKKS